MIITVDSEKALNRVWYPPMIKTCQGLGIGIERNFLNLTKGIYKKLTGNVILMEEDWNLL